MKLGLADAQVTTEEMHGKGEEAFLSAIKLHVTGASGLSALPQLAQPTLCCLREQIQTRPLHAPAQAT